MLRPPPAWPGLTHLVGDRRAVIMLPSLAGADLHLRVSRCPGAAGGASSARGSVTGLEGRGPRPQASPTGKASWKVGLQSPGLERSTPFGGLPTGSVWGAFPAGCGCTHRCLWCRSPA